MWRIPRASSCDTLPAYLTLSARSLTSLTRDKNRRGPPTPSRDRPTLENLPIGTRSGQLPFTYHANGNLTLRAPVDSSRHWASYGLRPDREDTHSHEFRNLDQWRHENISRDMARTPVSS